MTRTADLADPASPNGKEVLVPASRADWRAWLAANPDREEGLWVVHRKKSSGLDGPVYQELVEEALCFGWIDGQAKRVDEGRVLQWFSPRRRGSMWSVINKERIEGLQRSGLMTAAGQAAIDNAKADGTWSQTDEVDAVILPPDLEAALDAAPAARESYESLAVSAKKQVLWSVYGAKRPETRARRIEEIVSRLS